MAAFARAFFAVVLCVGCASAPKPVSDTLPEPVSEAPAAEAPPPELAKAFEPVPQTMTEAFGGGEQGALAKQTAQGLKVEPLPMLEDPRAAATEAWKQAQARARKGEPGAADEARKLAREVGPEAEQQAIELATRAALAAKDGQGAMQLSEQWLLACGPERIDACRARALSTLLSASKLKIPEAKRLHTALKAADDCVKKAEATRKAPACLDSAAQTYARERDALMELRVEVARGQALAADPKKAPAAAGALMAAEGSCNEARCVGVRRKALKAAAQVALKQEDRETAAKATLREARLASATLPPEKRKFGWTREADKVCALYEQRAGAGACRKLEQANHGEHLFRDYSAERSGAGLPPERVKQVNAHFGCLFEECLTEEAGRLKPPDSATYQVRWMVTNDGKVSTLSMAKAYENDGSLAKCLQKQLAWFRYPRFDGEWQHVEQSFTVTARERR